MGSLSALAVISALGVLVGNEISKYISFETIMALSGILFIIMGAHTFMKKEESIKSSPKRKGNPLIKSFFSVFLAEIGDKTQITVILLASLYHNTLNILIGAIVAFAILTSIGVYLGEIVKRLIKHEKKINTLVAGVFVFIGSLLLLNVCNAFLGAP